MTPKVSRGRSFKGVGQYLLHDKKAQSSERVAFTETLNLPTDNANAAIAHMIDTATHADDIKRRAGVSLRGQKQQRPVYHYSLAWHPSENITMAVQMEAARESLKALGFDDRQALIVSHNDTEHPHVHVVVNLVSTENGKFPKLGNDLLKLSDWALEYEKRRGVVFCKDREENQQRRKGGEYVKDESPERQDWEAWKKSQTKDIWDNFRADRAKASKSRQGQYDALWRQKEERLIQRKAEVKAYFKPKWRDLFRKQKHELKNFDAGFFDRLGFAFTRARRSKVIGFLQAVTNDVDLRLDFIRAQKQDRKALGVEHKRLVADASREVRKAWQYDHDSLKASHKAQDQRAYDDTKAKSSEVWKTPAPEQAKPDFEKKADRRKNPEKRKNANEKSRISKEDFTKKVREKRERNRSRKRPRR